MTGQASAADLYALLGVPSDADAAAIKVAYRRRARALHPDRNPDDPDADEKFSAVREAYEVLSDATRRREYDQQRQRPRPPPAARRAPPAAPRPYQSAPSGRDGPDLGHPVDGRRLEFDVVARPPSTPDLSALDWWSRGTGTVATVTVIVATVAGRRGTGMVSTVGAVLLTLAVLTLLVLLFVRTGQPHPGRLHVVAGATSLTFPARRGWQRFSPTARWAVAVGLLGAVLANTGDTVLVLALSLLRVELALGLIATLLARRIVPLVRLSRAAGRGRPPELTITAEGVTYVKGFTFWSCRWSELVEIGAPTLTGATRLATTRSRVRLGSRRLDSDTALVLQIIAFYAANLQDRHEIGTGAVTRLLRGDFDTPA